MIPSAVERYRDARSAIASLRLSEGATRVSTDLRASLRALDVALGVLIDTLLEGADRIEEPQVADIHVLADAVKAAAHRDGPDAARLVERVLRLVY